MLTPGQQSMIVGMQMTLKADVYNNNGTNKYILFEKWNVTTLGGFFGAIFFLIALSLLVEAISHIMWILTTKKKLHAQEEAVKSFI
mmetsp:Transcript_34155/g.24666  ORF Transcript_34155/g.24666 Transcript_34155/m.24666 type:complete len:86 (-) Transcript_34155:301-558(-)